MRAALILELRALLHDEQRRWDDGGSEMMTETMRGRGRARARVGVMMPTSLSSPAAAAAAAATELWWRIVDG